MPLSRMPHGISRRASTSPPEGASRTTSRHANLLISGPLAGSQEIPDLKSDETVFTYSVAPRFEVNDHTSVYARVATGYRPGGPT